ncbi:hypothetical protein MMC10_011128 [Thelotrema lepadinum]|nr:hypothetical protein [Thelotrema lepadinum]
MVSSIPFLTATAALLAPALAQSSCNPTKGACSTPDPALGKAISYDFTKGSPPTSDWSLSTGAFPTFNSSGAQFTIAKTLDSPTLSSKWYIMYGHYDIVAQIAPGQGVVSSSVLMSDTKDEVDLEWVGNQKDSLQCNYFGQGQEGSEQTVNVNNPTGGFHTYSIDWTPTALTWAVDGKVLRTVSSSEAHFPQTPSVLKIGTWPGGDPSEASGTIAWAGGPINYNDAPFTMTVQSVTVYDYSTGSSYAYSGTSGTASSISSNGGKISHFSSTSGMSVVPAVMGSSSTSTSTSTSTTPTSTSISSSSAAAASSTTTPVSASSASSSAPTVSSSSASAPFQIPSYSTSIVAATTPVPAPTTLTTLVQTVTPPAGGAPVPTTVTSAIPVASPTTGSGSGSGGTGTSQIPPPIQSEIAAISAKNPWLGQMLEGIWSWIEGMVHGGGQGRSH